MDIPNLCHNLGMYVVECLPLKQGLNKDSLSYFSAEAIEPGSLIRINLRSKKVSALVTKSKDARDVKSEIRKSTFQLKKISSVVSKPFLNQEFLKAAEDSAEYFCSNTGGVLFHIVPSMILEQPNLSHPGYKKPKDQEETKPKNQTKILVAGKEERFSHYRSLIREKFAKGHSIFLCMPQNEEVAEAEEKLSRGIESYVYTFHKSKTKKKLKEDWQKACRVRHPVLIIATPRWLLLPRLDLGMIIMEGENKSGWRTLARPFIDLRYFVEKLARYKNIDLVIGDSFPQVETLHRYRQGELTEFERVKWRPQREVAVKVVDLRETTKKEKDFKVLSPALSELITEVEKKRSQIFIFAVRKGLAPSTICRDCGEEVRCSNCSSPMVLYKKKPSGVFKCNQCGEVRNAAELCQKCGSWRLEAYGVGIDRIAAEIKKNFPEIKLFEIHKDATLTNTKAKQAAEDFYHSKGAIMLGTEMAIPYFHQKVGATAIASFDSLLFIPDFRIRSKIFRLILDIISLAKEEVLIQSRNPEDLAVKLALEGNLLKFYEKEIEDRRALSYPPFGLFIKIVARGTKRFVDKETEGLKKILAEYQPVIFNSLQEKKGRQAAINTVIKLPPYEWPHPKLIALLRSLPLHFEIQVDPDSLL